VWWWKSPASRTSRRPCGRARTACASTYAAEKK
jgi:hypothetical protein